MSADRIAAALNGNAGWHLDCRRVRGMAGVELRALAADAIRERRSQSGRAGGGSRTPPTDELAPSAGWALDCATSRTHGGVPDGPESARTAACGRPQPALMIEE